MEEVIPVGRIIAHVVIENYADRDKSIRCDAMVDTGASHMTLPSAWRERLGQFQETRTLEVEAATQEMVRAAICGPVRLQIEGFPAVSTEVAFIDMKPADGEYEPLLGYIPLEQSQAAVDMLGHRLVEVGHLDLK
jgi:predicted aspartyl protease